MLNSQSEIYKEKTMPNIKSAIKRVQVNQKKSLENKMVKSNLNSTVKKFKTALSAKDFAKAEELFKEVVSMLNNAAKDNIIHKNNASRKQAHFSKLLHDAKNAK